MKTTCQGEKSWVQKGEVLTRLRGGLAKRKKERLSNGGEKGDIKIKTGGEYLERDFVDQL